MNLQSNTNCAPLQSGAQLIKTALDISEMMLVSGAEVSRVEDSFMRICTACGAERADIFAVTSYMVATVVTQDGEFTQTRRVLHHDTDLTKLDKLNTLSRDICAGRKCIADASDELKHIAAQKGPSVYALAFAGTLIAGSFAVFFGGTWADALVSAVLGIILSFAKYWLTRTGINSLFANMICSFFVGITAMAAVSFGLGQNHGMIIIGDIMLLIPGVTLTNAMRDMVSGDTLSGLLRFSEALVIALSIAVGFGIAAYVMGALPW